MSKQLSFDLEEKQETDLKKTVRCRECDHEITTPAQARHPHEHTFRNPAGYSFHVLCYSDAPGTLELGTPTSDASWFPGYTWTLALCQQCQTHLGWWYSGPDQFAGLIATRLKR